MAENFLNSSDSVRSARPLRHAQTITFDKPMTLELGGQLPQVTVAYETYGRLSPQKDNAILVCHAISGDSHVARHDADDDAGWWDIVVGPGKAIDTDKYFVICPNILGSCRGTTGPGSDNPATGQPYGRDFPTITVGDMVATHHRLIYALGIAKLLAVVGGSMGGHQALAWSIAYPGLAKGIIPLATSPRLNSQALAFDIVGRNAILSDQNFQAGQYYANGPGPAVGLAIARMIGHITYLSPAAMQEKFEANRLQPRDVPTEFEKKFSVGSYLGYLGGKFVERFDANSYITLTMAMDLFDLGSTTAQLADSFRDSQSRYLVISYSSDWLFPPAQSREIVNALLACNKQVSYCNIASQCGHDAFLLENELALYGGLLQGFLQNLRDPSPQAPGLDEDDEDISGESPTSIFHRRRLDYDMLVDLIPPSAKVLDIGCGRGSLLNRLRLLGRGPLIGVDLHEQAILSCVKRGLDVIHGDLNNGMDEFADGQFDCVVLSQTLQAVRDVERTLLDIVRVGKQCIVSFPNFAYWKLRKMLAEEGKAPESPGLLRFKWYNSPNIRFFSISDFQGLCLEKNIKIHRFIALDSEQGKCVEDDPNLNADTAIFVISR
jgi:homoserine O-acetyltransferase